jgi:hypothetical protein
MLNRISLLTAVCMTASAGLFVTSTLAEDLTVTRNTAITADTTNNVKLPAGITAKDLNSDKSIDKSFKAITDDAMSKSGFDNLVAKLVDQDRDRIKKSVANNRSLSNVDGNNNKRLTDVIADIEGTFKSKYNSKFDIDISKSYTTDFIHIVTGEVSDPQLLVGKWPVDPVSLSDMSGGTAGKVTQSDADIAKSKTFGGDVNLEKGRNVALAHVMGSHGMKGFTASLIHENLVGWKFDVPNTMTADQLYNNLVANLSYLDQHKDAWPTDVNQAYREFTHAVSASLYNINISTGMNTANALDNGSPRPLDNTANNR